MKNKRRLIIYMCAALYLSGCGKAQPALSTSISVNDTSAISENSASKNGISKNAISNNTVSQNKPSEKIPEKVKGIYITGPIAGHEKMDSILDMVEETEINALIIDVKNDMGEITYHMETEAVNQTGAAVRYIRDMDSLIQKCKEKNIYLIARIVAFKDPILAENKPELSLKTKNGEIFRDKAGLAWVNPYKKEVWDYLMEISKEAVKIGFDEIQFDYIRFSTDSGMKEVDFGEEGIERSKTDVITEFTQYAYDTLKPSGAFVSADVYGTIIANKQDADIVGQDYVAMALILDYICPMIYPSHYNSGVYGLEVPDAAPYETILAAMKESDERLSVIPEGEHKAIVRPWLQDFTASWVKGYISYGATQVQEQIRGVYDAGYDEWIFWNAKNNYTKEGFVKAGEEQDAG